MLIKNPYETTFGSLITIENTKRELMKYLATSDVDKMSYEYLNEGNVKMVFITGYNQEEKDLPIWEHPILMQDIRGNNLIVSDIRKYMRAIDEMPMELNAVTKDVNGVEFVTLRALLTRDFINNKVGMHRDVFKSISTAMSIWLTGSISTTVGIDASEKAWMEVVVAHYVNIMMIEEDQVDDMLDNIKGRILKSRFSIPLTNKIMEDILSKLNNNVVDVNGLVDNIKTVVPEAKANFIDSNAIVNTINNSWYGHGNAETLVMALEHMPTFMTLLYVNAENKSYKRTMFANTIDKQKRIIKTDDYVKHIQRYLKENMV